PAHGGGHPGAADHAGRGAAHRRCHRADRRAVLPAPRRALARGSRGMRLEARGVTVRADGRAIVEDASLALAPGELIGPIGPYGAGKSTLLRAMVGVQARETGSVLLGEAALEGLSPRERARRVSYLPQERRVEWRLSVYDVVMLGRFPHRAPFGGSTDAD